MNHGSLSKQFIEQTVFFCLSTWLLSVFEAVSSDGSGELVVLGERADNEGSGANWKEKEKMVNGNS